MRVKKLFTDSKAPLGIKLIAGYWVLGGVWTIVIALAFAFFAKGILPNFLSHALGFNSLLSLASGFDASTSSTITVLAFGAMLLGAALNFYIAYGMLKLTSRGINWAFSWAVFGVIGYLGSQPADIFGWASLVIDLAILVYMVRYTNFFGSPTKLRVTPEDILNKSTK